MSRAAILLSGGYSHPFDDSSPALAALIEEAGWQPHVEESIGAAVADLADCPALLAVNALHWSMVQHEKYAPDRAAFAYALPYQHMDAIEQFVAGGGALYVQHVGTICFDTQPRWHDVMGGGWTWGRSHHPPMGKITVRLTEEGTRLSTGPEEFELLDEAYHNLDPAEDCTVLATSAIEEGPQPIAWVRTFGKGRVAVDALGHDARSINAPGHRELIAAQLAWLARDA